MVLPLAATILSAEPVIVVLPFSVESPDPADAELGLAMQSLVVHELASVMLEARSEDADVKDQAKLKGMTHVAHGAIVRLGKQVAVTAWLIDARDNKILFTIKLSGPTLWNDRRKFTSAIVEALKLPMPARPDGYDVNDDLARAWGAALRALKSGDPKVKDKVSAVVEKWPKFMPAKAQLAKL